MAQLRVDGYVFTIDLVVFDKDGTLIDFHHGWTQRANEAIMALVRRVSGGPDMTGRLYSSLGLDGEKDRVVPDSPLAVASLDRLHAVSATVLYQHGVPWHQAELAVRESFMPILEALPTAEELQPLGDLPQLFTDLTGAGVTIAVATSDDRAPTVECLSLLGIGGFVRALACGDDPLPKKPAPEVLWHLAEVCAIPLDRVMMVGDTAGDMVMGERAGVACRLGVLSGAGEKTTLAAHASLVVPDIRAIELLTPGSSPL